MLEVSVTSPVNKPVALASAANVVSLVGASVAWQGGVYAYTLQGKKKKRTIINVRIRGIYLFIYLIYTPKANLF